LSPQPNSSAPPPKSIFKNPSLYSYTVLVLSIFSVAWIFFSRWEQNRSIENRARQERTQKQLEEDRATLEQMGGKELAIQTFYATPGSIRRGETVQLCYGVANAKTVTLEPQSNPVWPSYSRCVDVTPAKTTTYTLTISDISGHTKSQSLEVRVR
jgi:cbb3-type cytochrome oxidase subunit 3